MVDGTYNGFFFTINPRVGYFLTNRLMVGSSLGFSISHNKLTGESNQNTTTNFSIGPVFRYYFFNNFFGEAQARYFTSKATSEFNFQDNEFKSNSLAWDLGVGYAFFLKDNIALEPILKYVRNYFKDRTNNNIRGNSRVGSGTLNFQVGFTIFLK